MQQEHSLEDDIWIEQSSARPTKTTVVTNNGCKVQTVMLNSETSKNTPSKSAPKRVLLKISKGNNQVKVKGQFVKKVRFDDQIPNLMELRRRRKDLARIDTPFVVPRKISPQPDNEVDNTSEIGDSDKEHSQFEDENGSTFFPRLYRPRVGMPTNRGKSNKDAGTAFRIAGPHIDIEQPKPLPQPSSPAYMENCLAVTDSNSQLPLMAKFSGEKSNSGFPRTGELSDTLFVSPEMTIPLSAKLPVIVIPHESIFSHYRNHYPYHRSNEIRSRPSPVLNLSLPAWEEKKPRRKDEALSNPSFSCQNPYLEKDLLFPTFNKCPGQSEISTKIRL